MIPEHGTRAECKRSLLGNVALTQCCNCGQPFVRQNLEAIEPFCPSCYEIIHGMSTALDYYLDRLNGVRAHDPRTRNQS
jgi:Zn finger protein HypA/HybF involved in hydrogenase expression